MGAPSPRAPKASPITTPMSKDISVFYPKCRMTALLGGSRSPTSLPCPRRQMSIYPGSQHLAKTSDQCKAWQRLKVTPVPLQTLGFPSVSHFFLNLTDVLNPSHPVRHWWGQEASNMHRRGNAAPNMAPMEDREEPEPLTVSTSFLTPPLIPSSRRRQWTDPPSFQQLPEPSWKRTSS